MTEIQPPSSTATLASSVYEKVRRGIVTAELPPGGKLRIDALSERYQVGGSPIREALNRLSAEGLVVQTDQRGFRVAPVGLEDLLELTRTRIWIDGAALRAAIERGDEAWADGVGLAYQRLARTPPQEAGKAGLSELWETRHRDFHLALLAACGSRWMLQFSGLLFDCFGRYRYVSTRPAAPRRAADDEHRAIMDLAIARRADEAVAALTEHYEETCQLVRPALDSR